MKPPEDYYGPLGGVVPAWYIDVTCSDDDKQHGIPGPDHPFYRLRKLIEEGLAKEQRNGEPQIELADKIMEIL